MTQIQGLNFREAKNNNFSSIVNIHNSNVRGENGSNDYGFLLVKTTEKEVITNLSNSFQYFVAVNDSNDVLGFLSLSQPKITDEFLNQMLWQDNYFSDKIVNNQERHLYINVVATKREYIGQGIGKFMYQSLYEQFPKSLLSSFIVTQPIFNHRSLIFHQKQGFQRIATFKCPQMMDLQNYESILMLKET